MAIKRVHVDNNNELPNVCLKSHIQRRIINGTVSLKGNCTDSDGEIEKVQFKIKYIHDKWFDAHLLNDSWWYELNTKQYSDGGYEFYFRAVDNESYFSPICREALWIDNKLPNFRLVTPSEGNLYILWNIFHRPLYTGKKTTVIGDLPIQIDVLNDEVLHSDYQCIFIYLNDNFFKYNLAEPKGPLYAVYENSEWNHRCFGDCKITAVGRNDNTHDYSKSISFNYLNLF
jgi:hypothetical protein